MSSGDKTNNSKSCIAVWFLVLGGILAIGILVTCLLEKHTTDVDKFETYQVTKFGTLISSNSNMFTDLDVTMSDGGTTTVYCNGLRTLYEDEVVLLKPSDTLYVSKSTLTGQPFDHTTRSANTCLITERHVVKDDDAPKHSSDDNIGEHGHITFLEREN